MNPTLTPSNSVELVDAVRSTPRLLAIGAGTKSRLSAVDCPKISTARLRGIVEYDPSEFTFTALAGTPLGEIIAALGEKGQYLPFDPVLVAAGATLGGTVAAGVSGPGRFRFGGVRDFILGVQFVDGAGRLLRMGGKVVKNAAGFDLPKFFVGSLGRYGILTEITFKVFPRPASQLTLRLDADKPESAVQIMTAAAKSRWELDALDWLPDKKIIVMRLAGPSAALQPLAQEILQRWSGRQLEETEANELWEGLREFRWADQTADLKEGALVKVALAPGNLATFRCAAAAVTDASVHVSSGGNMAFVAIADAANIKGFDERLRTLQLSGVTLRGKAPLWLGAISRPKIMQDIKMALDAENRFPGLDD